MIQNPQKPIVKQTISQQSGSKDIWNIILFLLITTELTIGIIAYVDEFTDMMSGYSRKSYVAYKLILDAIIFIVSSIYLLRRQQKIAILNMLIYLIIIDIALRFIAQAHINESNFDSGEMQNIFSLILYANQFIFPIIILFFSMRRRQDMREIVKQLVKDPIIQKQVDDKYSSKLDHKLFFMS